MAETMLPPLDVIGPDGSRLTIRSLPRAATVETLSAALGVNTIATRDGPLDPRDRLTTLDEIRVGTRLIASDPTPIPSSTVDPSDRDDGDDGGGGDGDGIEALTADVAIGVTADAVAEVAIVAGPACGSWTPLRPGRYLIGRAPHTNVRIDDPGVESHHGVVVVEADGTVRFTQLAGVVPVRIAGEAVAAGQSIDPGADVRIAASTLRFRRSRPGTSDGVSRDHGCLTPMVPGDGGEDDDRAAAPAGSIAPHVSDPWRRVVWRAPEVARPWQPDGVALPVAGPEPSAPSSTGLIGAGVAALGALVIAIVMSNSMFLIFAGIGATAALATWVVGVVTARRGRRRVRAEYAAAIETFRLELERVRSARTEHHRQTHRELADTLDAPRADPGRIWHRRVERSDLDGAADGDIPRSNGAADSVEHGRKVLTATVGTGTVRWRPPVDEADRSSTPANLAVIIERAGRVAGASAPISIAPGDAIALNGPMHLARSVARSVIVQLATWVGPADWRLVVVSAHPELWEWCNWLPHHGLRVGCVAPSADPDELAEALGTVEPDRRILLVTDEAQLFTARTGPLRRFLERSGASSLVVVGADDTVPAMCRRMLTIGATGRAGWVGDVEPHDDADAIDVVGVTVERAREAACELACLVDPEDTEATGAGVPATVSFAQLAGSGGPLTAAQVKRRWRAGGVDPALAAPLGWSGDGVVDVDLVRDGPHGLIAGTTGSGKSELLRTLVLSLATEVPPQHLNFVLVDYKGGSTFDACVELPHTVGIVTDLDEGLAARALVSLDAELHRRERLLRNVGATDLAEYRSRTGVGPIARLVVVIDEFAALAKELPDFLAALVGIAQRGRSLGLHLLLATQRPAGVVNDDIRMNTNLRLALRLNDRADALDVVADAVPTQFVRGLPGRAALRLGPDELIVFQAARCTGPVESSDDRRLTIERTVRPDDPDDDELDLVMSSGDGNDGRDVDLDRLPSACPDDAVTSACAESEPPSELDVAVRAIVEAAANERWPPVHRPWLDPLPHPRESRTTNGVGAFGVHRPWLDPLPHPLTSADLAAHVSQHPAEAADGLAEPAADVVAIGLIDVPAAQARRPLSWRPADGNLALIGSIGSGTTSTLISLAAATCRRRGADDVHLYVIDARGDDGLGALASLAHCGGVVRITEDERLHRLLARVVATIDRRLAGDDMPGAGVVGPGGRAPSTVGDVVVMIDGYGSVRTALGSVERAATYELLQRVLADGPSVGVATVIADDGAGTAVVSVPVGERWIFHLDDPTVAANIGVRSPPVPVGMPGRMRIGSTGLEGQVAVGAAGLAEIPARDATSTGPERIAVLPDAVVLPDRESRSAGEAGDQGCGHQAGGDEGCGDAVWRSRRNERGCELVVGLGGADLRPDALVVPDGDGVLVVGSARTGVTTTLERCVAAWCEAHGIDESIAPLTRELGELDGATPRVIRVDRRHPPDPGRIIDVAAPILLVVDDAHRVDDIEGVLVAIAHGEHPHVTVIAGGRADAIRTGYGHWTRELAKARCGVVMSSRGDPDGDVLGVTIPRRSLVPPRPGLGWIVDAGPLRQVQVATAG